MKSVVWLRPRAMKMDSEFILIVEQIVYADALDEACEKEEPGKTHIFGLKHWRNEAAIC